MSHLPLFIIFSAVFFLEAFIINGINQQQPQQMKCSISVLVDKSGRGNFTTIQAAINSIPSNNNQWVCIHIKKAVYREQVTIPLDKPFIYLKGEGARTTIIQYAAYSNNNIANATFTSLADNIIAESLTFMNTYNYPFNGHGNPMKSATAAMIQGDKTAFYSCGFIGLQDTLWDAQGRHYFRHCTIQGAVDFIFGSGQSLYEKCTISVAAGALNGTPGFITAQGRSLDNETNGFVFKNCNIIGSGKSFLGRPWRGYARVVYYNTSMADIIEPQGWDSWSSAGLEHNLTFEEMDCDGPGSDTSRRVNWVNKMSPGDLLQFINITFVDNEGWLNRNVPNI